MDDNPEDTGNGNKTLWWLLFKTKSYLKTDFYRGP